MDIKEILATSKERWGGQGSARYAALLAAAMQKVAATPLGPTTRDCSAMLADARSLHLRVLRGHGVSSPVHVIYYRSHADFVEIVRVLHERMDPAAHLRTKPAAVRSRRR